jgi:hypothetical protein
LIFLLFLFGLLAALGLLASFAGGSLATLVIIPLIIVVAGLGLIIAGYVYMFRAPASAYLAASR